jgi:nitroreductase
MNVKDAIEKRRSIRKFTDKPVSREDLLEIIEAARLSPSSINAQPWRFRIVTDRADIEWFSGPVTSKQRFIAGAPAVIVCCVDASAYMKDSRAVIHALRDAGMIDDEFVAEVENKYLNPVSEIPALVHASAALNLAIAMSAMMLRAVELGLGATWVGRVDDQPVRERLGLPDNVSVVALLPVGYPAESPEARPRKALEEILL